MLSRNVSLLHKAGRIAQQSVRTLMLQEHHGMVLLEKEGIKVPPHGVARTPEEAEQHARNIGGKDYVIKAQVLAGGRGKGHFDSGLQGGVQVVFTYAHCFYFISC
jgi:succinyl-CoA synthetase beta subunit